MTGALLDAVVDEAAARRELRRQIAHLEARGARTAPASWEGGPRLLSLGELEAVRDAMAARPSISCAHTLTDWTFAEARARLEAMVADPAAHCRTRISLADLGLPGCGTYAVRPRLGIIGRLAGWWQITLSSGCP